jgi:serine/threonine-protein kinase RIM15
VFENILAGQVDYHEEDVDYSDEARDFMKRLLTLDPTQRLGCNGADEVKAHPWFSDMEWDSITSKEAAFIPQVTDMESTEYFNARGAVPISFQDDDDQVALRHPTDSPGLSPDPSMHLHTASAPVMPPINGELMASMGDDSFGSFSFKNLPVLKQANEEMIKKLRTDQMAPLTHSLSEPSAASAHNRRRSISHRIKKPPSVVTSFDPKTIPTNPPSPATSTSSIASSPSRGTLPPSTPASAGHSRKGSEMGAVDRFRVTHDSEGSRRPASGPSRLRTASVSTSHSGEGSGSDVNSGSVQSQGEAQTPPSSVASLDWKPEKVDRSDSRKPEPVDLRKKPDPQDRAVTCLLAEDNPITAKIIETLLIRLGCRCVVVADGSEAISVAMGDIRGLSLALSWSTLLITGHQTSTSFSWTCKCLCWMVRALLDTSRVQTVKTRPRPLLPSVRTAVASPLSRVRASSLHRLPSLCRSQTFLQSCAKSGSRRRPLRRVARAR